MSMMKPIDLCIGERVIPLYCPNAGEAVSLFKSVRAFTRTWSLTPKGTLVCDCISLRGYARTVLKNNRTSYLSRKGITVRRLDESDVQALTVLGVLKSGEVENIRAEIKIGRQIEEAESAAHEAERELRKFGLELTGRQKAKIKRHIAALEKSLGKQQ